MKRGENEQVDGLQDQFSALSELDQELLVAPVRGALKIISPHLPSFSLVDGETTQVKFLEEGLSQVAPLGRILKSPKLQAVVLNQMSNADKSQGHLEYPTRYLGLEQPRYFFQKDLKTTMILSQS